MSPASLSSVPSSPRSKGDGPRLLTPSTNAIQLISAKYGRNHSTIHTVAVVALFMLQFRALVADPYRVMLLELCPLALLQCAYCVVCLPPTGTWLNTTSSSGNEAAGSAMGRSTKGSGTGSMRKRRLGLARTSASGVWGWKGKAMVSVSSFAATESRSTNQIARFSPLSSPLP